MTSPSKWDVGWRPSSSSWGTSFTFSSSERTESCRGSFRSSFFNYGTFRDLVWGVYSPSISDNNSLSLICSHKTTISVVRRPFCSNNLSFLSISVGNLWMDWSFFSNDLSVTSFRSRASISENFSGLVRVWVWGLINSSSRAFSNKESNLKFTKK